MLYNEQAPNRLRTAILARLARRLFAPISSEAPALAAALGCEMIGAMVRNDNSLPRMIDEKAKEQALRYGTPECVHVPIAAVDEAAISTYVGDIVRVLSGGSARRAFLVQAREPPSRDERFPIWDIKNSAILFQPLQVWVDVAYTRYRRAYRTAFPEQDISGQILSHAMNRRTAVLKGFAFVRLTPTSRAANSSSAFSEGWGVEFHSDPDQMLRNKRRGVFIHYADVAELMLMLDLNLGGGVMNAVNEGQALIRPRSM